MADHVQAFGVGPTESTAANPPSCPCVMLLFGASGDLTKRLLMPALFNLACDGLLPEQVCHRRHRPWTIGPPSSSAST